MTIVIKAYGPVWDPTCSIEGEYLEAYDPEAHNGRGDAKFTKELDKAMTFESHVEAVTFASQVPKARPLREDGKPNKPLTAFTLEFIPREEAAAEQ